MVMKLSCEEVNAFLEVAADSFLHDECMTCECFLGYVTRLRVDANNDSQDLIAKYQVERSTVHSCLGCDPCPPGNLYAEYVRKHKPNSPLIVL